MHAGGFFGDGTSKAPLSEPLGKEGGDGCFTSAVDAFDSYEDSSGDGTFHGGVRFNGILRADAMPKCTNPAYTQDLRLFTDGADACILGLHAGACMAGLQA